LSGSKVTNFVSPVASSLKQQVFIHFSSGDGRIGGQLHLSQKQGRIASNTSGRTGVVALWSR
jgi:hypothetical protein